MSHHAAHYFHSGLVAAPYGMVGAPTDYPGLCATIANQGEKDGNINADPVYGFERMEKKMRDEGLVTTMTQEDARTCYMQGYDRGRISPTEAGIGGLVIGGIGGIIVGIIGTLAVQSWK
jgi:hypothetical protein